jgi:3-hydroxyisobutyrate dehydrogenase
MGSAMARNAARAGLTVRAWSRPLRDAKRLSRGGIVVASTAAAASAESELVVTMVPDAKAIESFSSGPDGFLDAMAPDAIWVQCSTVGVTPAYRLIDLAGAHGVRIVDAPVLGSREPAERGELVILASGDEHAIARCARLFDAVARRVLELGPAGNGSRMKMVTNAWIVSAVAGVADSMALSEALGLDGRTFLEAIHGTAIDMGYAQIKGEMMAARSYPVQMTLANAIKDARLVLAAARAQRLPARTIAAAAELMDAAASRGWAAHDMAAAFQGAVAAAGTTDPGETR